MKFNVKPSCEILFTKQGEGLTAHLVESGHVARGRRQCQRYSQSTAYF